MDKRAPIADGATYAGRSVLLVEDAWHVASALKSVLERAGLNVVGPAATLSDAQMLLERQMPDLAVVDLNLQGQLSIGLLDRLSDQDVPVIVITGYEASPELAGRVAAILSKPVHANVLLDTLHRVVVARRNS